MNTAYVGKNLFHKAVLTYLCDKPLNEETSLDIYTVKMPERLLEKVRQILSPRHGHLK